MMSALWFQMLHHVWWNRLPGQLVIQTTDACNASCPQCGMRITNEFKRSRLSLEQLRRVMEAAAEKRFQAISFTGGEPLLFLDDLIEMIRYAGHVGIPCIRTGTNGFIFTGSEKKGFSSRIERIAHALADTPIRNFWISIDSVVPEVHEQMRGLPGVIDGIQKALPIFHASGIFPAANLGINRNLAGKMPSGNDYLHPDKFYEHYRSGFDRFYRFVCDLGFTMVNCCYPMSIPDAKVGSGLSPVYAATATDLVINFSRNEKALLFQALSETIPKYRSRIRIFTPRTSLLALTRQALRREPKSHPCRGGIDFFFMDARTGHTYPCGYRGNTDMGKFEDLKFRNLLKVGSDCRECDWECFRDPSELMGPAFTLRKHPVQAIKRLAADRTYSRLWLEDLRYYRACGFFDGRKAPESKKLRQYAL